MEISTMIAKKSRAILIFASSIGVVLSGAAFSIVAAAELTVPAPPAEVAAQVDRILRTEVPYANAAKASPARIDDERFLRRASLDFIGRIPTPEEVTTFALDP